MKNERFVALDALRGVFAVMVVVFHYAFYFNSPLTHVKWLESCYLMVDAFFVLSGFVMVHATAGRLQTGRDALAFMVRRFFRLWPLHALVLLWLVSQELLKLYLQSGYGVAVAHPAFSDAFALDKLAASVFLVHSLGLFDGRVWNVPSWSISTEFYAYIVFMLVALRASSVRLIALAGMLSLISAIFLLELPGNTMDVTTQGGFSRCLFGFFTGVLTYYAYAWISRTRLFKAFLQAIQLLAVAMLCMFMAYAGTTPLGFFAPIVFALLVISLANDQGWLATGLQIAPLQFLGKISYSVYLVHYPLILLAYRALELVQQHHDVGVTYGLVNGYPMLGFAQLWQVLVFFTVLSLLTLMASYLSWRWVELPCQEAGRRWASKLRKR